MDCSQRRLLRRGLEFHVCTINKSVLAKNDGYFLMILELLLSVALSESRCIFTLESSSSPCKSFKMFIHSVFCYVLFVPIFCFNIFFPFFIRLFICLRTFSFLLAGRIFFCCYGISCFFCIFFILSRYHFILPSFTSTFLFISSSCIFILIVVLLFSFHLNVFSLSYHFYLL